MRARKVTRALGGDANAKKPRAPSISPSSPSGSKPNHRMTAIRCVTALISISLSAAFLLEPRNAKRRPLLPTPPRATVEETPLQVNGAQDQAYGAGQITVLEGLEPVRKRPGMYVRMKNR